MVGGSFVNKNVIYAFIFTINSCFYYICYLCHYASKINYYKEGLKHISDKTSEAPKG